MGDVVYYELYEPTYRQVGNIVKLHDDIFKNKAKSSYYSDMINTSHYPFWMAVDKDDNELLGFIATKVKPKDSLVYVASLATQSNVNGLKAPLIKQVLKDSKKLGAKYVTTHSRKSSKNNRESFKKLGFEESVEGTYRDGEKKYLLKYTFEDVEEKPIKISKKKYKKRKKIIAGSKPKEGVFTIRDATAADISKVLSLHNRYLKKKREYGYFSSKLRFSDPLFFVAVDSNNEVVGYLMCRLERKSGFTKGPYTVVNFISMGVDKEYRGWGIGKALVKHLISEVKKRPHLEYIYGHVRGSNIAARSLYKKMGFSEKKVGKYKDDDDEKYMIKKRIRFPAIKPYWNEYKGYMAWFIVGIGTHEVIHMVRDYE